MSDESIQRKNASRLVFVQALYGAHFDIPIKSAESWVSQYNEDLLSDADNPETEEERHSEEVFQMKTEVTPDMQFLRKLLRGWLEQKAAVEYELSMHLDGRKKRGFSRLSPLIQSVICAGMYELHHTNIKKPVVLKEYTDVASGFFDNPELGYINGMLQEMADSAKAPEVDLDVETSEGNSDAEVSLNQK
ncbi:MAG: transcription antitermination factor NusB [Rickettsiales bacterium]|nr:transcription antitermination factor NusB [Rickettsiales bacterium]